MDMKEILKSGIEQALQETINSGGLPAGEYPEIVLEVPPQKEFGDFSTNIAMQSARVARQNPRAIAEALISHMDFDWLERAEVAGAGFINFFLKSDMVYDTLKAILNAGDQYGVQPLRARDTIQVEYVSANPTGPLHVGHGRGAAYGSALVNLYVQQVIMYNPSTTSMMQVTKSIIWLSPLSTVSKSCKVLH